MVSNFDPNKDPRYFDDIRKKTYYNIDSKQTQRYTKVSIKIYLFDK